MGPSPATVASTGFLYGIVIAWAAFTHYKNSRLFRYGLISLLVFTSLMTYGKWQGGNGKSLYTMFRNTRPLTWSQDRLPVYRRQHLQEDGLLQNFHLKPARILPQLTLQQDSLKNAFSLPPFYQFGNKNLPLSTTHLLLQPHRAI